MSTSPGGARHIIGHNIAIYHKNPDGVVIEFYCEMDQMHDEELGYFEPRPWHQDRPQRPKVWGDGTLSNWWGPMSHSPNRTHPAPTAPAEDPARELRDVGCGQGAQPERGKPAKGIGTSPASLRTPEPPCRPAFETWKGRRIALDQGATRTLPI